MPGIEQLLLQLNRGIVSLPATRVELAGLIHLHGSDAPHVVATIQRALATGQLGDEAARALLETVANAQDRTQVHAPTSPDPVSGNDAPSDATTAYTRLPDADLTIRSHRGAEATLLHPAPDAAAPLDAHGNALFADAGLTIRKSVASDSTDSTELMGSDLGELDRSPVTEARTLHAAQRQLDDPPHATTARVSQRAQSVANPPVSAPAPVQHGELQPGAVIKQRFLLDSLIGKGGMGLVFSAIDRRKEEARDPNSRIALKILNADFQRHARSFIALQREARKAQTLAHPNVVTVFDFDRDGDAVYMTMELLKGRSLEAMTREARGKGIGRDRALPIIRGIAEGLAYAHRKGIVHSDLKPGNVFITSDGTPKILDFGIARAVPNPTDETPDLFDAGSLGAYTEAYATNEMVNGIDPHPADDMYALGIIGHELLTGFHPFQRHSAPSARKLGIKAAPLKGVRRREARALAHCLSFDRDARPRNAAEFLRSFQGVGTLQRAAITVAAVLAVAAGYLWYLNYLATSPAVPFGSLPAATQQQFSAHIKEGNEEWSFYQRDKNVAALQFAVEQYATAYSLHPRNHEAVRGLKRTADALLAAGKNPQERREIANFLRQQSDFFRRYQPVIDAAE